MTAIRSERLKLSESKLSTSEPDNSLPLFLVFVYLLLLLFVEHHLCIGDLSSGRNQGQHKRERKTRKTKNVYLIKNKKPQDIRR